MSRPRAAVVWLTIADRSPRGWNSSGNATVVASHVCRPEGPIPTDCRLAKVTLNLPDGFFADPQITVDFPDLPMNGGGSGAAERV